MKHFGINWRKSLQVLCQKPKEHLGTSKWQTIIKLKETKIDMSDLYETGNPFIC